MTCKPITLALVVAAVLPAAAAWASDVPTAKKVPKMVTVNGETLQDDYFWLRERENPEVKAYLEKENAFAAEFMKPTEQLQKTLYDEMLGRIKETDLSVPYRETGAISTIREPRRESSTRSTVARRAASRRPSRSTSTSTSSPRASGS